VTTYLNVPFSQKAEAKAKGARWDSEARKWFVPIGRDLEPFSSWLPVDPSTLASKALTTETKGVPLSTLLAGVATAVEQVFRQGVWTTAEVVRVDGDPHVYLELAERDEAGTLLAKARGIVWGRDVERVLGTFQAATGVRLAAGIKVLIRARPAFSPQHGLTLHIDAIDPTYTLGDLEAKKRQIRERLKAEGIFERNRQLPAPWDYRVLLVVSPPRAAGLGDFARDADRLQRHRVCEAVYVHSRFEGEDAPALIRDAIEEALSTWTAALPDAIVIIRGGGAVNDLAWLNDYELARWICLSPLPVLTGIGHERDSTVLDEVAHQRFDTPSKVIAGIQSLIVSRARESQEAFDELAGLAERRLRTARLAVDQCNTSIERQVLETVLRARSDTQQDMAAVQQRARQGLHDASHGALHALSDIRAGAGARLATARANSSSLIAQIDAAATASVQNARRSINDAERDVVARAHQAVAGQWKRTAELFDEVEQQARNTVRWGADAAEASFREVVAQGPQKTLSRGFAVVRSPEGGVITSAAVAVEAKGIEVEFQDGSIDASVVRDKEKRDE
jgi:exodeoxyribonuclease VII large subunit